MIVTGFPRYRIGGAASVSLVAAVDRPIVLIVDGVTESFPLAFRPLGHATHDGYPVMS